ncbi:NTP/NDP exchange transporter [Corallincola platygyrae]|uniref:NTP/NDP exchange transporter n=1 Tax=Corallincola platygyrae TaxID=1193278 RepID=A0ABW4XKQ2_9GAMM
MASSTVSSFTHRTLNLISKVHRDEHPVLLWFSVKAFVLLFAYYHLKPLREALMLSEHDAEIRSYATAIQALILLLAMPVYGYIVRHFGTTRMFTRILWTTLLCLFGFWLGYRTGWSVAGAFYVWLGIFNVLLVAQFWAECAAFYQPESGKRLFPVIAAGATLGGLLGALVSRQLFVLGGADAAFIVAILGYLFLILAPNPQVTTSEQKADEDKPKSRMHWFRGFNQMLKSHYLIAIALFVVLLNLGNSVGEFILAKWVYLELEGASAIGAFYGSFFSWVNLATVLCQLFLVSRLIRWLGVSGALLIVPMLMFFGYLALFVLPFFWLTYAYKVAENSLDYSLQNTLRHALFLPLSGVQLYEGKAVIDTLCWRLGDLLQLAIVLAGTHWLMLEIRGYLVVNIVLALLWIAACLWLGKMARSRC